MQTSWIWGIAIVGGPLLLGLAIAYALIIRPRRRARLDTRSNRRG